MHYLNNEENTSFVYTHTEDTSLLLWTCFVHWKTILYSCFNICHPWHQNDLTKAKRHSLSPIISEISPSALALPTSLLLSYFSSDVSPFAHILDPMPPAFLRILPYKFAFLSDLLIKMPFSDRSCLSASLLYHRS